MEQSDPLNVETAFEETGEALPACAYPGCRERGRYKAPSSPKNAGTFVLFCLEHVRAHNAAWDYFAGMDEDQIEASRRADSTWERPTWRLGSLGAWQTTAHYRFDDGFGHFSNGRGERRNGGNGHAASGLTAEQRRALSTLGLEAGAGKKEIKARYKALAKKLHPDANGNNAKAEERLKRVNRAYQTLKGLA